DPSPLPGEMTTTTHQTKKVTPATPERAILPEPILDDDVPPAAPAGPRAGRGPVCRLLHARAPAFRAARCHPQAGTRAHRPADRPARPQQEPLGAGSLERVAWLRRRCAARGVERLAAQLRA